MVDNVIMGTTGFGVCPGCGESLEEVGHCEDGEENGYFVCEDCDLSFMMDFDDDDTCHTIGDSLGRPRDSVTDVTPEPSVTEDGCVTPEVLMKIDKACGDYPDRPSLEHYQDSPEYYVQRAHPERLNWGPYMTADQLAEAGLVANRVSIPGDWDYQGLVQVHAGKGQGLGVVASAFDEQARKDAERGCATESGMLERIEQAAIAMGYLPKDTIKQC